MNGAFQFLLACYPELKTATLAVYQTTLSPGEGTASKISDILSDGSAADLSKATIVYTSDSEAVSIGRQGVSKAVYEGRANVQATVTPDGKTVDSNPVTITVAKLLADGVPGHPVLSDNKVHDHGLKDRSYFVTMNMWWGNNGTQLKLYENGVLVKTQVYRTHLQPHTVEVTDALPGKPDLSHDNWNQDGNYRISMNLCWGTNGSEYRLYETGKLFESKQLPESTPTAQRVITDLTGRILGNYVYRAELINSSGVTSYAKCSLTNFCHVHRAEVRGVLQKCHFKQVNVTTINR